MPQHESQQSAPNPTAVRAGTGRWLSAVILTAGLLLAPTVGADTAGKAAKQASPLAEERAAKAAAAEAAEKDALDPGLVPDPPEQASGPDSGDEMLIELPIVPAGTRPDEAHTSVPATSEETAAAPDGTAELESLRVLFPEGGVTIDADAELELDELAGLLNANHGQRVVLHAYAGGNDQGRSDARRLSLSRALVIRGFLVDRGVPVERIFLRPLGSEVEDGPPDRVDILPLRP